jgi:hypothetical protein
MKSNDIPGGNENPGFSAINWRTYATTARSMNAPLDAEAPSIRTQTRAASTRQLASCEMSHVVRFRRIPTARPPLVWRSGQEGRAERRRDFNSDEGII